MKEGLESVYKSAKWRKLRALVIARANGICEICHEKPATIAHHIIEVTPESKGNLALVWSADNLQAVCRDCHTKIHEGVEVMRFTDEGQPIPPRDQR